MNKYDDIINLPRHVSKTHPQMDQSERAKQFAPFAALKGYEEAIKEKQKEKEAKVYFTETSQSIIDEKLRSLKKGNKVTISYFDIKTDTKKSISGQLTSITPEMLNIRVNNVDIEFQNILDIL